MKILRDFKPTLCSVTKVMGEGPYPEKNTLSNGCGGSEIDYLNIKCFLQKASKSKSIPTHPAGTSVISSKNDKINNFCSHFSIGVYEKIYFKS